MALKRYLGIDWGKKRIGLALGDSETKLATPLKVVGSLQEVKEVVRDESIDMIVLGVPFSKTERSAPASGPFLSFAKGLGSLKSVKVETVDERLSSKAADALAGNKKTKAARDAIAAMVILQSYLDKN